MKRRIAFVLLAALLIAGISLLMVKGLQRQALSQKLNIDANTFFAIDAGATPSGMLTKLEAQGIIEDAFWLRVYWRLNHASDTIHIGEYLLEPGMRVQDVLNKWRTGDVVQYSLTLVPGWTYKQVREALANKDALVSTLDDLSNTELMQALGAKVTHPEGMFFPDTYRYVKGTKDTELLKQAHQRLETVLEQEWAQRAPDLPYQEPYQALIMASLIERETGAAHERAEIAGVFVRRLKLGMLLQTDPTVIYGMGDAYQGKITRADLRKPTPYNTYVNAGLTPTPIALVGREAIHAALHPREGKALYFVAKGDGTHVFSETLDAHNKAVREYQLKRRADYRSSPAPRAD